MRIVYADNNATTQVAPEVYEAMIPFFTENYFNPSSMYEPARSTAEVVARSREGIARHLGAGDPKQILFTSCASESNNTAIQGVVKANPTRRHIITTSVEHPAVLEVCRDIERGGFDVTFLSVDQDGNLDLREFVRALRPDTLLVTVMHANNETGVIFPVAELARITKETDSKIVFHTDATQSIGKLPIDLQREYRHVDLLSFSGHKLHAPKGIGALYIRRGTPCRPLLIGGHQEGGRRAGTENVPYIVALAKAMDLAMANLDEEQTKVRQLRDRLETSLAERISHIQINGKAAPRLPNTSNVSCYSIEGESMLFELSEYGICASSGSACTSGTLEPSHVLRALNVPFMAVHGSIRFSFSRYNTDDDIDRIIEIFPEIVTRLRRASPYWDAKTNIPRQSAEDTVHAKNS
ncbi:MAG: cysteine desulfurase NifS [Planctomycetes bacterium]|nr:cysteine desulfurase NifS [Planctomycetota bacterium]MBL7038379.1 cysteine desulfurase NifS [Pirellulaceae bacterium]